VPEAAWLHAFTVGALGMMMIGLMTRVSLRHTGRVRCAPPLMRIAAAAMFVATTLRVAASAQGMAPWVVTLALASWAAACVAYLLRFGAVLIAPSLPREQKGAISANRG
jgi:uncharacterized protein involved in response to NO